MPQCALASCRKPFTGRKGQRYHTRACQLAARRKPAPTEELPTHLVIPDTQAKAGVPNDHLRWIGQWAKHRYGGKPLTVVHLGDHWDLPSLSSYDKGKGAMEGRRYKTDIDAGNRAFAVLDDAMGEQPLWRKVLLRGNHENRIARAVESDIQLEGLLTMDDLDSRDWEVHDFLEPVTIDGVIYSHYFYQPMSGRPYSGGVELRLKNIGHSFTQGHQQGLISAQRAVGATRHRGLVAGSCYQHAEEYRGPQAQNEWRGVLVCNNVVDGNYDLMEVGLDYFCRRYEGHSLRDHNGVEL